MKPPDESGHLYRALDYLTQGKVVEATFQRLLKDSGSPASYSGVLDDLEQLRAVRFEARGKVWLRRVLPEALFEAMVRRFFGLGGKA